MKKRPSQKNVSIHIWLHPKDAERWKKNAERCGMSQNEYVRRLLRGVVPKEFPPKDYAEILREMRRIREAVETEAEIAKLSGNAGSDSFFEMVRSYNDLIRELTDSAYDEPEASYDEEATLYGNL